MRIRCVCVCVCMCVYVCVCVCVEVKFKSVFIQNLVRKKVVFLVFGRFFPQLVNQLQLLDY